MISVKMPSLDNPRDIYIYILYMSVSPTHLLLDIHKHGSWDLTKIPSIEEKKSDEDGHHDDYDHHSDDRCQDPQP